MNDSSDERHTSRTIAEVGEFALIERIRSYLGPSRAVRGIGDDAAVLDIGAPNYLLATVDSLVEGVHFPSSRIGAGPLGERAIAVNVSDIAAMGGEPLSALVSLVLPREAPQSWVDELYDGLKNAADHYGVEILGGNFSSTGGPIVIDVTLIGTVGRDDVVLRTGAIAGDLLAVTGFLGAAAASRLLEARTALMQDSSLAQELAVEGRPVARVKEGRSLARAHLVHAMLDVSDGLSGDVAHLCRASEVGAVVDAKGLPISSATREAARLLSADPAELALSGGEDYELLLALSPAALSAAQDATGGCVSVIGEVVPAGEGLTLRDSTGIRRPLESTGWTHFAR